MSATRIETLEHAIIGKVIGLVESSIYEIIINQGKRTD